MSHNADRKQAINLLVQVLGEGVPAQSDETVVYGNDAIRPAFLVLYQPPPPLPV